MNLSSTILIYAGGAGSGCNPEVGKCGRPHSMDGDSTGPRKPTGDKPPQGYIRIYRGVNPERNKIASNDDTHGYWYTTTYDDAVRYANWDYDGTGELGPNRAILAVDVPIKDAFEYAQSGSRRQVRDEDELLDEDRPVEMLVDADVADSAEIIEGDLEQGKLGKPKR